MTPIVIVIVNSKSLRSNPIPPVDRQRVLKPRHGTLTANNVSLRTLIYYAYGVDAFHTSAHAREFSQDLRHQDQVGVAAGRLELKDWRERKSGWPRRILNYAALASIPIVIFYFAALGGEKGLIRGDFRFVLGSF